MKKKPYSAECRWLLDRRSAWRVSTSQWARDSKPRFRWTGLPCHLKQDGQFVARHKYLFRSAHAAHSHYYIPQPARRLAQRRTNGCLFSQIDKRLRTSRRFWSRLSLALWQDTRTARSLGFHQRHTRTGDDTDTIQPLQHRRVDLQGSEDDIMARMKSSTRYSIRLAARKEVAVREGTLRTFHLLQPDARKQASR